MAPIPEIKMVSENKNENNKAPILQQQQPQLKIEDIRETMIDVLKSNFPDILSLSLRNALPVQQPQEKGLDRKLTELLKILLANFRELTVFERAKIDEALGGAPEKLLFYFENNEDILPQNKIPQAPKKKDSENIDIYMNPKNSEKNSPPKKNPIDYEEKKVEEPKNQFAPKEKPWNLNLVNSESVIIQKPQNNEKKPELLEYSCQYVKDLSTLPKNLTVNDSTILKTISLRNNGSKKWPDGCTLEYVSGLKIKAIKMAAADVGKDFSTVIQIESPKKAGTFSCFLRFACPVYGIMKYPNDAFELTVEIEADKKSVIVPPKDDNEVPKDWAAKLKLVKEIIPDVDEKKVFDILKSNPKASSDDVINALFA